MKTIPDHRATFLTLSQAWRSSSWFQLACITSLLNIATVSPAQTMLYWGGGAVDIVGSPALAGGSGTWNTTIQNWAIDGSGSSYQPWTNGAGNTAVLATIPANSTITVEGDLILSALQFDNPDGNNFTYTVQGAAPGQILQLSGAEPLIRVRRNGTVANSQGGAVLWCNESDSP